MVQCRWKHPNTVRSRIDKNIKPHLGRLALVAAEPRHIDILLRAVLKRGMVRFNPARHSTCRSQAARKSSATGHCHATS